MTQRWFNPLNAPEPAPAGTQQPDPVSGPVPDADTDPIPEQQDLNEDQPVDTTPQQETTSSDVSSSQAASSEESSREDGPWHWRLRRWRTAAAVAAAVAVTGFLVIPSGDGTTRSFDLGMSAPANADSARSADDLTPRQAADEDLLEAEEAFAEGRPLESVKPRRGDVWWLTSADTILFARAAGDTCLVYAVVAGAPTVVEPASPANCTRQAMDASAKELAELTGVTPSVQHRD